MTTAMQVSSPASQPPSTTSIPEKASSAKHAELCRLRSLFSHSTLNDALDLRHVVASCDEEGRFRNDLRRRKTPAPSSMPYSFPTPQGSSAAFSKRWRDSKWKIGMRSSMCGKWEAGGQYTDGTDLPLPSYSASTTSRTRLKGRCGKCSASKTAPSCGSASRWTR